MVSAEIQSYRSCLTQSCQFLYAFDLLYFAQLSLQHSNAWSVINKDQTLSWEVGANGQTYYSASFSRYVNGSDSHQCQLRE